MPTLLPDDEISEIMSFDIKQHALFNVVLEWSKKYVIFILTPLQYSTHSLFLIGCRGTITRDIPCSIKNNSKRPEKPQVLLLGPTSISAIKVGGTTIHSGLGIKPGTKLMSLRENKLSEFKLIIINEL